MRYPAVTSLTRVMTLVLAIGSQASYAQDLGLELFARMHMPSGKLVERSIKNDDVLRSGDGLRATVRLSSEGFLYVLHQGITRATVLYPPSLAPTAAVRVRNGDQIVLPGEGMFFTLDEVLGPERVLALLTQAPIQDMNTVLVAAAASPVDRDALRALGVEDAAEVVFAHIASTALAPAPGTPPSAGVEANETASTGVVDDGVARQANQSGDQILGDVGSRIDEVLIDLDIERSAPAPSSTTTRRDAPSERHEFVDTTPGGDDASRKQARPLTDDPADLAVVTIVEDPDATLDSDGGQDADEEGTSTARAGTPVTQAPVVDDDSLRQAQLLDDPADAARVTIIEGEDAQEDASVDLARAEPAISADVDDAATTSREAERTAAAQALVPGQTAEPASTGQPKTKVASVSSAERFDVVRASAVLIATSRGFASGALLDADGHVLTNWHVLEGRQTVPLLVQTGWDAGGAAQMTTARVLAVNRAPDLALLRLQAPLRALQPINVPESLRLELGDAVFALGSADSTLSLTMTEGEVESFVPSASWRSSSVEHEASVIRARVRGRTAGSGTLLLDDNLRLVGIGISSDNGAQGFSAVSLDSILEFLAEFGGGKVRLSKG